MGLLWCFRCATITSTETVIHSTGSWLELWLYWPWWHSSCPKVQNTTTLVIVSMMPGKVLSLWHGSMESKRKLRYKIKSLTQKSSSMKRVISQTTKIIQVIWMEWEAIQRKLSKELVKLLVSIINLACILKKRSLSSTELWRKYSLFGKSGGTF